MRLVPKNNTVTFGEEEAAEEAEVTETPESSETGGGPALVLLSSPGSLLFSAAHPRATAKTNKYRMLIAQEVTREYM
ncbi:MAG TPA: hypothetical protein VGC52_03905, partial [Gemmatimonadaceae bacterium]